MTTAWATRPSARTEMEAAGRPSRVVTLTPAPAIDRIYVLDGLRTGHVNRARHIEAHIGGNGVNLARDLRAAGNEVSAVVPLNVDSVGDLVVDDDVFRVVSVPHPARVNTVIITRDGATTNVNQAANPLTELDWTAMCSAVAQESERLRPDWLVVGGAVPDGGGGSGPHRIAEQAWRSGARLCLDSPGAVVAHWLGEGVVPHLLSPNVSELQDATGRSVHTMGDAIDGASRLMDAGVDTVLVSLGEQGALLMTGDERMWARAPAADVVNTTGAGDAALAGLMARWAGESDTVSLERALATAVRWGRAAVGKITPTISPEDVTFSQVEIESPERATPLT